MSVSYEALAVGLLTGSFSFPKAHALIFIKRPFLFGLEGDQKRNRQLLCTFFVHRYSF